MNNQKIYVVIMIVLFGLTGLTVVQILGGETVETVDVVQDISELRFQEGENLSIVDEGVTLDDPYRTGYALTEPYYENTENNITEIDKNVDPYIQSHIVNTTLSIYDGEDELVDEHVYTAESETLGEDEYLFVEEDEYVEIEVYIER